MGVPGKSPKRASVEECGSTWIQEEVSRTDLRLWYCPSCSSEMWAYVLLRKNQAASGAPESRSSGLGAHADLACSHAKLLWQLRQ